MTRKKKENKFLPILLIGGGAAALYFLSKNKSSGDMSPYPLLQNNNPLAIINTGISWQGLADENLNPTWEAFQSMPYGFRAAILNGKAYVNNIPNMDLGDFLSYWAFGGSQAANNYAQFVSSQTGRPINFKMKQLFDNRDMGGLWEIYRAMAIFENSTASTPVIDGLYDEFVQGFNLAFA